MSVFWVKMNEKCVGAAASKMVERNKRECNVFFCAFETSSVHKKCR